MSVIDLTKQLKKYKSGWVALNKKYEVVGAGSSFEKISQKIKNYPKKENLILMPASTNYFGYVT